MGETKPKKKNWMKHQKNNEWKTILKRHRNTTTKLKAFSLQTDPCVLQYQLLLLCIGNYILIMLLWVGFYWIGKSFASSRDRYISSENIKTKRNFCR